MGLRKTNLPRGERSRQAYELYRAGKTSREIGLLMDVLQTTAINLVRTGRMNAGDYSTIRGRRPRPIVMGLHRCRRCGLRGDHVCIDVRFYVDAPSNLARCVDDRA
jgi:hypothetical protein